MIAGNLERTFGQLKMSPPLTLSSDFVRCGRVSKHFPVNAPGSSPFPEDLPDLGIKSGSLALQADSLLSEPP